MSTIQYKCLNCGGEIKWNAVDKKFTCEYCSSSFEEQEIKSAFPDEDSVKQTQNSMKNTPLRDELDEFENKTGLYSCPSCGANVISETGGAAANGGATDFVSGKTTAATFCYYCHNPVILTGRLSGEYRPDSVIPFNIDKKKAKEIFLDWCGKRWFLPNDFRSSKTLEKITGVYVPFWLADCNTSGNMNAIGKISQTRRQGDYNVTTTKEYRIRRAADIDFKGVPADGSNKINDELMGAIEPFDYSKIKNFDMSFLSGFIAEKYDANKETVFPIIKEKVDKAITSILSGDAKEVYTSVSIISSNVNINNVEWQYSLLPVWFLHYKYRDKDYEFAINGQSGKIAGTAPLNYGKLLMVSGAIAVVAAALVTVIKMWG